MNPIGSFKAHIMNDKASAVTQLTGNRRKSNSQPSDEYTVQGVYNARHWTMEPSSIGSCAPVKRVGFVRMSDIYSVATNMITDRKWEM